MDNLQVEKQFMITYLEYNVVQVGRLSLRVQVDGMYSLVSKQKLWCLQFTKPIKRHIIMHKQTLYNSLIFKNILSFWTFTSLTLLIQAVLIGVLEQFLVGLIKIKLHV